MKAYKIFLFILLTFSSCEKNKMENKMENKKYSILLDSIYKYYPKDIEPGSKKYFSSKEHMNLISVCEQQAGKEAFELLVENTQKVLKNLRVDNSSYVELTQPCFRMRVNTYTKDKYNFVDIVVNISLLVKQYSFYKASYHRKIVNQNFGDLQYLEDLQSHQKSAQITFDDFSPEEQEILNTISQHIKKRFPAYEETPKILVQAKIPELAHPATGIKGQGTIFDFIFTDHIW